MEPKILEVQIKAVGSAIINMLQTTCLLGDSDNRLHRLNNFAFKPCDHCTRNDYTEEELISSA